MLLLACCSKAVQRNIIEFGDVHFGGFRQGAFNILFPLMPVMQINTSCVSLTSLLALILVQKLFLWEQQIGLTYFCTLASLKRKTNLWSVPVRRPIADVRLRSSGIGEHAVRQIF